MDTPPEPLLLPVDLSQLCVGANGQQLEVMITFSAAIKTCHLKFIVCELNLEGFLLGFHFLLFLWILRFHHGWEVILWICDSSWLLGMRNKHVDGKVVATWMRLTEPQISKWVSETADIVIVPYNVNGGFKLIELPWPVWLSSGPKGHRFNSWSRASTWVAVLSPDPTMQKATKWCVSLISLSLCPPPFHTI